MPDRLIPPKPDDIIVWHDPVRRGMCRAAINGLDSAGSRRVQLRRYHVDAGGQMFPKAGVSFDPREFRQIAQHLLATLNDHPGATGASQNHATAIANARRCKNAPLGVTASRLSERGVRRTDDNAEGTRHSNP